MALDVLGQLLGELAFAATAAGYVELQRWAERLGDVQRLAFGIEGAGSWGAGLSAFIFASSAGAARSRR